MRWGGMAWHPTEHFDLLAQWVRLERADAQARRSQASKDLSLGERERRGWVWLDLEAVEETVGLGGRVLVTLRRPQDRQAAPLHAGDMVEVRPRKAEIDHPPVALVARASRREVQLAFDRPPPPFVAEGRLRLDEVPNDVTVERTLAALARWKAVDRGPALERRRRWLGELPPRFEPAEAAPALGELNPEQALAARRALSAQDFFLVHGPPGTGKSTVLAEVAVQAVARGQRVLCTAASNAAVDHLLELCLDRGLAAIRVGHPARVAPGLVAHTLDVAVEEMEDRQVARDLYDEADALLGHARKQRTQGRSRTRFAQARASSADARQLRAEARALEKKALRSLLDRAPVLCATLSSLDGQVLADEAFDLVLLDEATQATEPLSWVGLWRAPVAVLAGDPCQLAPTVLSPRAAASGLSRSLFERLLDEHGEGASLMLREQYRMHSDIMALPSAAFYQGALRAHPVAAARTLGDWPPLLFVDTAGKGFEEAQGELDASLFNVGEAELVTAHAKALLAGGAGPGDLAVITPYAAQAAYLRDQGLPEEVEIDTVDAFQGREAEAVLVSLTRSNPRGEIGFLSDLRRINVALTRARRHLFVVGDSATLASHAFYAGFIEHVQRQGGYRSAWEWPPC